MKTFSAKPSDIDKKWLLIDAEGLVVGRLAAFVATRLRGKHKPSYTPHMDCGDNVIVINADKVRFTGSKWDQKEYQRYSGYPGGLKRRTASEVLAKNPIAIIENAVKAATRDPRFSPVTPSEVSDLSFSIDVILPMEKVKDVKDLDPKKFGLVIKSDQKQGVLLPDLDGVQSVRDQIHICRNKGRIQANDPQEMYRFQVHRFN